MTEKLKHCPFCGGVAVFDQGIAAGNGSATFSATHYCVTLQTRIQTRNYGSEKDAASIWNRRMEPVSRREEVTQP
ncbi:Lar family restriction alleviation protein [Desulfitobacterium hafniense]|uniref:Lar family restriction alleviation protein n=1 Tax=Desulfitobacterium hafniense TaxID=49338 RepID=UPI00035CA430